MTLIVEEDRVIITEFEEEGLHEDVVFDVVSSNTPDHIIFGRQFDIVGDYRTDRDYWDHGHEKITIIRRKSDGRLFGYLWWWSPDGESIADPNGDQHGFEFGYEVEGDWSTFKVTYVWLPVVQTTMPTYKIA